MTDVTFVTTFVTCLIKLVESLIEVMINTNVTSELDFGYWLVAGNSWFCW